MNIWTRLKNKFNQYLESIAEENKKTFGEGKLDCCNLNSKSGDQTKNNKIS